MDDMERKQIIRDFFKEKRKKEVPADDVNLFENGFVDSLFAIEIVLFLEREFKIQIKNKDITKENFKDIDHICEVVAKSKSKKK